MRRLGLAIACVIAFFTARPASAIIGTIDQVPAATLLFPYFEVDLANPNGRTTVIAVTNSSASAGVVNVTIWSDLGIPTASFPIYLTGYDTQSINLRDIFVNRAFPVTADAGSDPTDTLSPKGIYSQDINFPVCGADPDNFGFGDDGPLRNIPPYTPAFSTAVQTDLQRALQGLSSTNGTYAPAGRCVGRNYGDNVARGYITMDDVNACPAPGQLPTSVGYFASGFNGVVGYRNIYHGDVFYLDPSQNFMEADVAVPIEASLNNPLTSEIASGTKYTFYGRMPTVNGLAIDSREPLPTAWGASSLGEHSRLFVWRDPAAAVADFSCGLTPPPYPLSMNQVVSFDTEENPNTGLPTTRFPFGAVETKLGAPSFVGLEKKGWMFLNLNSGGGLFGGIRGSWVTVIHSPEATGIHGVGWSGWQLGNAAYAEDPILAAP